MSWAVSAAQCQETSSTPSPIWVPFPCSPFQPLRAPVPELLPESTRLRLLANGQFLPTSPGAAAATQDLDGP